MVAGLEPLLDLYGVVDEVFQQPGAFDEDRRHISLGRIYRKWKEVKPKLEN